MATKRMEHAGPFSRTHAILEPTCPLLRTFFAIRLDSRITTPAAGSVDLPFASRGASADGIHPSEM